MRWLNRPRTLPFRPWLVLWGCLVTVAPSAAQWELGAYIGGAHTQSSDLLLRQPALETNLRFDDIGYCGGSFETPIYYGVRSGYRLRPRWAAEVEFIHLKVFANVADTVSMSGTLHGSPLSARQPAETIVQQFSISHGVNLLMGNIVFRQPLGRSRRLNLALRVGAGATIPHPESTIEGHADAHYQLGSAAMQLGAGVELHVWRKLWWVGEYKYTTTRQTVDVFSGTAASALRSHHAVTGPALHF